MVLILCGPKHCGKSSTALVLKEMLSIPSYDVDTEIERLSGKSPRVLFEEGQKIFRNAESSAIAILLKNISNSDSKNAIIALGGGFIDNELATSILRNHTTLKKLIKIIYLDISPDAAWERIEKTCALPAFLKSAADPKQAHSDIHKRRSISYKKIADITIDAENKSIADIAKEIVTTLDARYVKSNDKKFLESLAVSP
jgi:shikimate kinase